MGDRRQVAAENGKNAPAKVRKLLSLGQHSLVDFKALKQSTDWFADGGGVRGLSTIIILRYLMDRLSLQRGKTIEPWEEFDMIGGTSTGG